jgi:hypothetical protein
MQMLMEKAATGTDRQDGEYGSSLLAEVARIRADAERLQHEYESRRDLRGALRAIETRLSVIELAARFTGQIEVKQRNELHLHFTRDRALQMAEAYVSRHGAEKPVQLLPPDPPSSEIIQTTELEEGE